MLNMKHTTEFDKTKFPNNAYNKVIPKAMKIRVNPFTVNRDNGQDILDTWTSDIIDFVK